MARIWIQNVAFSKFAGPDCMVKISELNRVSLFSAFLMAREQWALGVSTYIIHYQIWENIVNSKAGIWEGEGEISNVEGHDLPALFDM